MAKKRKKIFLLLSGGTCILDKQGRIFCVQNQEDIDNWMQNMPELSIVADIETIFVQGEDDIVGAGTWEKLAENIVLKMIEADGFVVVTKLDQIINTSLALSFMLQNFQKTIVVTGAQFSGSHFLNKKHLNRGALGLRTNIINSIQVASNSLPGPAIMFGTKLLAPYLAMENSFGEEDKFLSINNKYWGQLDFGININKDLNFSNNKTRIYSKIKANVLVLENIPGLDWYFDQESLAAYDGILIKADSYQDLEKEKKKIIDKIKIPVFIYTHSTNNSLTNLINISYCSYPSALIKIIWALANKSDIKDLKKIIASNIIGEFFS